jgi:hypothetical protein
MTPLQTSAALASSKVVQLLRYQLTIRPQFDILQFGWQGTECNSIN